MKLGCIVWVVVDVDVDGGAGNIVGKESKVSHCVVTTTAPDVFLLDGSCCLATIGGENFPIERLDCGCGCGCGCGWWLPPLLDS